MGHSEWTCVSVRVVCIKWRLRVCACARMWEECALKYEGVWVWMWEECAEWGDRVSVWIWEECALKEDWECVCMKVREV